MKNNLSRLVLVAAMLCFSLNHQLVGFPDQLLPNCADTTIGLIMGGAMDAQKVAPHAATEARLIEWLNSEGISLTPQKHEEFTNGRWLIRGWESNVQTFFDRRKKDPMLIQMAQNFFADFLQANSSYIMKFKNQSERVDLSDPRWMSWMVDFIHAQYNSAKVGFELLRDNTKRSDRLQRARKLFVRVMLIEFFQTYCCPPLPSQRFPVP